VTPIARDVLVVLVSVIITACVMRWSAEVETDFRVLRARMADVEAAQLTLDDAQAMLELDAFEIAEALTWALTPGVCEWDMVSGADDLRIRDVVALNCPHRAPPPPCRVRWTMGGAADSSQSWGGL
jgi:hypothetical protein|tara:strand:- start:704 stop:1081 length:378 start_codon:yes stop_codon:yes gene_type:complete